MVAVIASISGLAVGSSAQQPRWGYEPAVGVTPPGATPGTGEFVNTRWTPTFNVPDGVWNNGEGFVRPNGLPSDNVADTGGYFGFDDGSGLILSDVHAQVLWDDYQYTDPTPASSTVGPGNIGSVDLLRFVGFLHPNTATNPMPAGMDGFLAESAFEVFIPKTFVAGPTVIVVKAWHTKGRADEGLYTGNPASAFGNPANAGLVGGLDAGSDHISRLGAHRLAAFSGRPESDGVNIIAAYPVPAMPGGHFTVTAQRVLQVAAAIQAIFATPASPLYPVEALGVMPPAGDKLPVCVSGGSNGGFIAQFLATHYPDRVHGACWTQISLDMRDTVGYQAAFRHISSLQGFSSIAGEWRDPYCLAYAAPFVQDGFTKGWATGSALRIWEAGLAKRPMYVVGGDEDSVWSGQETAALLDPAPTQSWKPEGANHTGPASLYWTIVDKACHEDRGIYEIQADVLANPPGAGNGAGHAMSGQQSEMALAILPFLDEVVQSSIDEVQNFGHLLTAADRPTEAQVEAPTGLGTAGTTYPTEPHDSRIDPLGWVFERGSTQARRAAITNPGTLTVTESHAFRRQSKSIGVGLGRGESLVVDSAGDVWVGSEDGIVTWLKKDPLADKLVIHQRCLPDATATQLDGPYSLGYSISGLAVNDEYVAVATYTRLYVYNRASDPTLSSPTIVPALPWTQHQPSRMQLVDGFFGDDGTQLIYVSLQGEVVVRELGAPSLDVVGHFSDPDCRDFEVGLSVEGGLSKPLFLATRNHIVKVLLDQDLSATNPSTVSVVGASKLVGHTSDLTWGLGENGSLLSALVLKPFGGELKGIREFDPSVSPALALEEQISFDVPNEDQAFASGGRKGEQLESLGSGLYAATFKGTLVVTGSAYGIEKFGLKADQVADPSVSTLAFPAAHYATALAVGDIGGDGDVDLVLATESGQVAYIPRSILVSQSLSTIMSQVVGDEMPGGSTNPTPDLFSTGSVSATWGMTWGPSAAMPGTDAIQIVDQCARRWEVDPVTGTYTYRNLVLDRVSGQPSIVAKPFRDLVWLDEDAPLEGELDLTQESRGDVHSPARGAHYYVESTRNQAAAPLPDNPAVPSGLESVPTVVEQGPLFSIWGPVTAVQVFENGYLPLGYAGDWLQSMSSPVRKEVYFWSGINVAGAEGADPFRVNVCNNSIRGIVYPHPAPASSFWSSTSGSSYVVSQPEWQAHLRNPASTSTHSSQSLRVGQWGMLQSDVRVIASTVGGGLLALNPSNAQAGPGAWIEEQPPVAGDLGFGGVALCVDQVVIGSGEPSIFFAPLYAHGRARTGAWGGRDASGVISVWQYTAAASPALARVSSLQLDGQTGRPRVFGIAGIGTGDLIAEPSDGAAAELVIGSLDGDLLIFDLHASGGSGTVQIGALLHHSIYDGAIGANNAILVQDRTVEYPAVLFLAGSSGMRRFTVN